MFFLKREGTNYAKMHEGIIAYFYSALRAKEHKAIVAGYNELRYI